ncbi:anti-sigma factor, partial [Patulibacter sp. S7RM1-6]
PSRGTVPADATPDPGPRRRSFLQALWAPRVAALAAVVVAIVVAVAVVTTGGDDPGSQTTEVTAQVTGRGSGRVQVAPDRGKLVVRGMASPGDGRQYQVWLQTGKDDPRPSVTFDVDDNGDGEAELPDLADVDAVLVTSEPAGGSKAPTTQPVVQASV